MTNRQKIEAKCITEGVTIQHLLYVTGTERCWVLWLHQPAFIAHIPLVKIHGDGALYTAWIEPTEVDEFVNTRIALWF